MSSHPYNELLAKLFKLLKQQNQCFEQALFPALQEQFKCLANLDTKNLVEANQNADRWIKVAQKNQSSIETITRHLGGSPDRDGLNAIVERLPAQVKAKFQRIINALSLRQEQCHAFNERNGELLSRQTQLLKSLLGQHPEQYATNKGFL